MPAVEPDERDALLDMLHRMFSYRPEDRPTVKEVLGMEWMKKWALPAFEKSHG